MVHKAVQFAARFARKRTLRLPIAGIKLSDALRRRRCASVGRRPVTSAECGYVRAWPQIALEHRIEQ